MNITYTLPIPDDRADAFITAFAAYHGWNSQSELTPLEHGRRILNQFVRESVTAHLALQAAEQAKHQAVATLTTQFEGIESTIGAS